MILFQGVELSDLERCWGDRWAQMVQEVQTAAGVIMENMMVTDAPLLCPPGRGVNVVDEPLDPKHGQAKEMECFWSKWEMEYHKSAPCFHYLKSEQAQEAREYFINYTTHSL